MKVLASMRGDGPAARRMGPAVAALGLRGHLLGWKAGDGRPAPPGAVTVRSTSDLWNLGAEVVVSDAAEPLLPAWDGWRANAGCLVMALAHEHVRRWRAPAHWAWDSLHGAGLAEPAEAETFRAAPLGLDLDLLGLWSDDPPPSAPDVAHADADVLERACERALARHRSRSPRAAVFLDRDGTLVREVGYLADPAQVELLPGVPEALRALQAEGYAVVVISNQSGVARGFFGLARVHETMARMRGLLRSHGVELDAVYFCPHHPDAGCACRKPGIALLERAAEDLQLRLRGSFMIGDKDVDVETGRRAGATPILVRTGYGREEEKRFPRDSAPRVCEDLAEAAGWILSRERKP